MISYIEDVFISGDLYLNYADCSPKAGTLGAREYLAAKKIGNDVMRSHAAKDFIAYSWSEEDNSFNLFYKLLALSQYTEIEEEARKERRVQTL